jgi:hypothetical protein
LGQEVLRRLVINLSKLDEFKHFEAAFAGLTFREEGMGPSHADGDLPLRQPCFLACRNQFLNELVIQSLMLRRPAFTGYACLRFFMFLHPSSVGNA